MADAFAITVV